MQIRNRKGKFARISCNMERLLSLSNDCSETPESVCSLHCFLREVCGFTCRGCLYPINRRTRQRTDGLGGTSPISIRGGLGQGNCCCIIAIRTAQRSHARSRLDTTDVLSSRLARTIPPTNLKTSKVLPIRCTLPFFWRRPSACRSR